MAQTVKRLPIIPETWVWSLGWEDPLEKEMEAHYIIIKNKPRKNEQGNCMNKKKLTDVSILLFSSPLGMVT